MSRKTISWQEFEVSESNNAPLKQAIEWFLILQEEPVSPRKMQDFTRWLDADRKHRQAWQEAESLWAASALLTENREKAKGLKRRDLLAGIAIMATGGLGYTLFTRKRPDFSTARGEMREVLLPDGSRAELSTDTAISIDFTPLRRNVTLVSGEAFFDVAADAARPFIVQAGTGQTEALGTAFSVALDQDGTTTVTVVEHAVSLRHPAGTLRLESGQTAAYDNTQIGVIQDDDAEIRLAWRDRRLVFVNAPLHKAVDALNRWGGGRIVLMDATIEHLQVTLIVNLQSGDDIAGQLIASLPVKSFRISPYLTLLYGG